MSVFSFGTKAETLECLYHSMELLNAKVLFPFYFTVNEWRKEKDKIIPQIASKVGLSDYLIVRSSAKNEDSAAESHAGEYESVICNNTNQAIIDAVESVIASYGDAGDDDQVLIQKAIDDIDCAGVVFSMEANTGGNYYVINYDDTTGSSSSITSGNGKDTKLYYWFSESEKYPENDCLAKVCHLVDSLRKVTDREALDIEFCFSEGELYVLQARPLIVKANSRDVYSQKEILNRIHDKIKSQNTPKPYLHGSRTIYGVMPDWNPAEMIGIHPRNLATSIYKEIITDDVWAYQRDNYGYAMLRSFPLMMDFCGFPYIDVRVSFNSFIPADLDDAIAEKLVNYYLDRLEECPQIHDKVEFNIVFSCYTFDLPKRIRILREYGFSEREITEIVNSLRNLTKKIANSESGLWKTDSEKLLILEERRNVIMNSNLDQVSKAFWLLEDCKRYGTLPFAGLARAGFIAVQLLSSMVSEGIISPEDNEAFMNDLQTVGSQMKNDFSAMNKESFLLKYGFLRPGTYDICSARYDEAPDIYFDWNKKLQRNTEEKKDKFRLSLQQMSKIRDVLAQHEMGEDVLGLFSFIKGAIEGRERAKFIFTHNVSEILKLMGDWGQNLGFSRDDMSFADIQLVKEVYKGSVEEKSTLEQSIICGRRKYEEGIGVFLPPLIVYEEDVFGFFIPDSQPNYITQKRVQGDICKDIVSEEADIENKILLIESADPGYDWIFSHQIKGFVTKYGGANSHMAIRAGELAIPAVVGAGERLYQELYAANSVEIDSANKTVRVLR